MSNLVPPDDSSRNLDTTKVVARAEPIRKNRGRPRKALPAYEGSRLDVSSAEVVQIPINHLNLDDTTFQARATTRPEILIDSIRFAFTDNERRKTLDGLDRANAMRKLRESGHARTTADVGGMFRISERQVQRLEGLLETPEVLRRAIADPESGISSTHALVLNQTMRASGQSFPLDAWLKIREQRLSVAALKKAFRGARVKPGREHPTVVVDPHRIVIARKKLSRATSEERRNLRFCCFLWRQRWTLPIPPTSMSGVLRRLEIFGYYDS